MNSIRKKLPIGLQTLSELIQEGHYYVDKTGFAQRLIETGKYYFLSRPRRFGKSLFLDTLKEIFEGNEALFHGLAIHPHWNWQQTFPVIRLSFGGGNLKNPAALAQVMHRQLERHELRFHLPARYPDGRSRLADLIERLHAERGQKVVVLVDEYDKPILDNLENASVAAQMREDLKDIYSVIKDCDAFIRFAFLTGVSKFTKVSLFSGLNNLNDITLNPDYSAICGYTAADLAGELAPEMAGLDPAQVRHWYNGYSWLGEAVYNPFDLLLLFERRAFSAWWFESGTPAFLLKLLGERQAYLPQLGQMVADAELLSTFDVEHISTVALMFQSGYLTIAKVEQIGDNQYYQLGFPNHEVRVSFYSSLLRIWAANPEQEIQNKIALPRLLASNDLAGLQTLFHSFFASIPYNWYSNNPIAQFEGFYASVFYSYFVASGLDVRVEDATNLGRIDMSVRLAHCVYLFEFKVVELLPQGRALQQIKDKGYAEKYRGGGVPIYLVGVEFSKLGRNLLGFEVETFA
jgi:Predicted AAA-ATPase/PD-(D/E)XK nuclease superfamily